MQDTVDRILEQWDREFPGLDVSPMGILGRISRASAAIDRRIGSRLEEFGLQPGEFDLLATLRRAGAPYQLAVGDLLKSAMVSSSAVTNRLDKLASKGFVTRELDPTNRRSIIVTMTPKGLETVEAALPEHLKNEHSMIGSFTQSQRVQFANLLRKLLLELGEDKDR